MVEDDKPLDEALTDIFGEPEPLPNSGNPPEPVVAATNEPDPATDELADMLCRDYATGLYSTEEIAHRAGISPEHVRFFVDDPDLEPLIRWHRAQWMADDNQAERVRRQASMVVEMGIGTLGQRLLDPDPNVSTAQRLAVFDSVAKLTGLVVNNQSVQGGGGPRMAINIHITGQQAVQVAPMIEHALGGG